MKKFLHNQPFVLESGGVLPEIEIAYHTYGNLNASRDNVVWVCHALTANSDPMDWWNGLFGPNRLFDPAEYFIVCANVLGGCYGTTGPLSIQSRNARVYYHEFPFITIRDMARAHELLRLHLQIEKIAIGIGGSLGGMQLLEWNIAKPQVFEATVLIATNAVHSPWGIAFNEAQRLAIQADPTWQLSTKRAGLDGLKAARAMALLSYRHYQAYQATQSEQADDVIDGFKASAYQNHQGKKLVDRFNAFSYWTLSKAMDSHNIGRGRGGVEAALKTISNKVLVIGIQSDILFPEHEQRRIAQGLKNGRFRTISSDHGHDGFLIETERLTRVIGHFIQDLQSVLLNDSTKA